MRIMLIQPDETRVQVFPLIFRPLALESIAAHLEVHEVSIVDVRVEDRPLEELLADARPQVVGVTCTFTTGVRMAQRAIAAVRQALPEAKVVVGGVHASLQPGDFSGPAMADFIIRGDGGPALRELVDALERGGDPREVPGLFFVEGSELRDTGPRRDPPWSERYLLPARGLTERYRGRYTPAPDGSELVLMVSSKGCPYRCSFCAAWKLQGGKLDSRSVGSILEELESVEEDFVYLFDDNSFADRRMMAELAERLLQRGVKKRYQAWTSTNLICRAPELIGRWREAGLVRVFCGIESVAEGRLKAMGKRATVEHNRRAVEICRDLDVEVTATFIVDPDFSPEDFDALAEYTERLGIRTPYFFIMTPLPGTELFEQRARDIMEGDPARYDLLHLTSRPRHLAPEAFMKRFADLYLENPSWRASRELHPVYEKLLGGVEALAEQWAPSRPIEGFQPGQAVLFPPG